MDDYDHFDYALPLFQDEARESVKGLEFYLASLEEHVSDQRDSEISDLQRLADRLPEGKQGEFWVWHYPVHWDDIIASQLRSSFVVSVISRAESHVGMVTDLIADHVPRPHREHEGVFKWHCRHLRGAGFCRPEAATWNALNEIYTVRNCIVHSNSRIYAEGSKTKRQCLTALAGTLPGLSAPYDVIQMTQKFPLHALRVVEATILGLYDEAAAWRARGVNRASGDLASLPGDAVAG